MSLCPLYRITPCGCRWASVCCRLFQYSPKRLLDEVPTMFAFPKLSTIFGTIADRIPATVRTGGATRRVGSWTDKLVTSSCSSGCGSEV